MRARVVAASVVVHVVLVIAGARPSRPPVVDIEIAAPRVTTEVAAPPPPVERAGPSGGSPIMQPAPPRRAPSARKPAPRVAPPDPVPSPATEGEPGAAPPGDADSATDDDAGNGGGGTGGDGGGVGSGVGHGVDIDRSARPIPLNASTSQTLPYTEAAARARISGSVVLVLLVDPLGNVGRVTVRRGLGHGLDEIAVKLARQIRFRPALDRAGNPTVATVRWGFQFQPP